MLVDDDRVYPRDALETYLGSSELLPDRNSVISVRQCCEVWIGATSKCISKHSSKVSRLDTNLLKTPAT
jgi:hypothetical protein